MLRAVFQNVLPAGGREHIFEKSEKKDLTKEGEHDKTLTGKKPTKVDVDPELKDK